MIVGEELNQRAARAAFRLLFGLQYELSEPTLIGSECFPWKWFTPAGVGWAEAVFLNAKAARLMLGIVHGLMVVFQTRSTDWAGRLN